MSRILSAGGEVYTLWVDRQTPPGQTHPPGQTPPWTDTTPRQTPSGRHPIRQTPPGRPPGRQPPGKTPPIRRPMQQMVRILLECILVTAHKRSLGQGCIFTGVCLSVNRGGLPGRPPCKGDPPPLPGRPRCQGDPPTRETPQAHTQGGNWAESDPGPHPRGKLRGDQIQAHTQGGNSGGSGPDHPPHDDYCCGRYASYWNAFLFLNNFTWSDILKYLFCLRVVIYSITPHHLVYIYVSQNLNISNQNIKLWFQGWSSFATGASKWAATASEKVRFFQNLCERAKVFTDMLCIIMYVGN